MPEALFALSDCEFDEIAFCASGDNPPAKMVLAKSDPELAKTYKTGRGAGGGKHHKDGWKKTEHKAQMGSDGKCKLCEQGGSAGVHKSGTNNGSVRTGTVDRKTPEDGMPETINKEDLADEVVTYIEKLESDLETVRAELAKDDDDDDDDKSDDKESVDDVLAKADPAVKALIEKANADVAKAQKDASDAMEVAKAERDARLTREFIAKAEALPHIEGTPEEVGELLKSLHAADPALATKLEEKLSKANAGLESGAMFAELGAGGASTTVGSKVEKMAEEIRKANPKLSEPEAIAAVYDAHPELLGEDLEGAK